MNEGRNIEQRKTESNKERMKEREKDGRTSWKNKNKEIQKYRNTE